MLLILVLLRLFIVMVENVAEHFPTLKIIAKVSHLLLHVINASEGLNHFTVHIRTHLVQNYFIHVFFGQGVDPLFQLRVFHTDVFQLFEHYVLQHMLLLVQLP